ncbi:ComEC family competence protein [Gemella morbillorum]|uniref:ComEC/Rec2 family competence protein n=1 Tax=Gemella morbillorum TaxID=29391 RepID=UPI000DA33A71|nr:ComEC/Rec2 family competence protein [Gemella morbillorum]UBH80196.1 ComEC/Rec2 family competence protein [Gemella morbillorum]SQH55581.1 ComEC family competence protein [Gemella morbillorum]
MYYLQLAILALGAVLLNYNFLISMLCIIIFLLITWKNKNLNARKTIICIIVFLAFFIRGAYEQKTNTTHISDEKNIDIILTIDDRIQVNGNYLKGIAKLNKEKVLFTYILKDEKEKTFFKEYFQGGMLKVNADIEDIGEKKNFYSFDYKKYNENKGIFKNVKVNDIKNFEENKGIISKIKIWRISLGNKIHKEISFDKSGYIEALIFGDKAYLEKDEIINYKNLGTSHLLAISGLHLGVLISLIYFILLRLRFSVEIIEKIVFLVIPFYMLISGFSPSVLRAGGMIMLYIIFRKKDMTKLEALLTTFILMLFINPLLIFDIGFELSFLITFCLLMSDDFLSGSKNIFTSGFKISLVSSLASLPILVMNFYTFSYISIISNIFLVPIFSLVIFPLVLISYVVFLFSSTIFNVIFKPILNISFSFFDKIQDLFLNFSPVVIGRHNNYVGVIIFIFILGILIYLNKNKFLLATLGVLLLFFTLLGFSYIGEDKIEEVKIGKGEIYYVRGGRHNLLVNTSNNIQNFYNDFRKKDVEYDIINEYNKMLNYEGKRKIDYLVLTSFKRDKVGYASELVGKDMVNEVIVLDKNKHKLKEIIELVKFKGIKVIEIKENTGFDLGTIKFYYGERQFSVKGKDREFKIEVDD